MCLENSESGLNNIKAYYKAKGRQGLVGESEQSVVLVLFRGIRLVGSTVASKLKMHNFSLLMVRLCTAKYCRVPATALTISVYID